MGLGFISMYDGNEYYWYDLSLMNVSKALVCILYTQIPDANNIHCVKCNLYRSLLNRDLLCMFNNIDVDCLIWVSY